MESSSDLQETPSDWWGEKQEQFLADDGYEIVG
jgi:hypothetical protein